MADRKPTSICPFRRHSRKMAVRRGGVTFVKAVQWVFVALTIGIVIMLLVAVVQIFLGSPPGPTRRPPPPPQPSLPPPPLPAMVTDWPENAVAAPQSFPMDTPSPGPPEPVVPYEPPLPAAGSIDIETLIGTAMPDGLEPPSNDDPHAASFGRHILELRRQPTDLVIVLDATLSMETPLRRLRQQAAHLAGVLAGALPRLRIAVVAYRDEGARRPTEVLGFSEGPQQLVSFVDNIGVEPGVDGKGRHDAPEQPERGLRAAMSIAWRDGARRVVILVGDAPPRANGLWSAQQEALKLAASGRRFVAVHVRTSTAGSTVTPGGEGAANVRENFYAQTHDAFRALAQYAKGDYIALDDAARIGPTLLHAVLGPETGDAHVARLWQAFAPPDRPTENRTERGRR